MNTDQKRFIIIGQVAKPFGIRGEVKITPFTESPEVFDRSEFLLFDESPYRVLKIRIHKGAVLATLQGIDTIEQASKLVRCLVRIDADSLPPKEDDEYYWFDLIGLKVSTVDGRNLGEITRITPTGANDVLHVEGELGEILLPMIEDVVLTVDLENKVMIVDPLEGLVPDD